MSKLVQKLEVKRDICKLAFEMRCYRRIFENEGKYISNLDFDKYIANYAKWDERLDEVLRRSKDLRINPNRLAYALDDVENEIALLESSTSLEEVDEVETLIQEIDQLLASISNPESLACELIYLYEFLRRYKIESLNSNYFFDIAHKLIEEYSTCRKDSEEYKLVTRYTIEDENLDRLFYTYFFKGSIPIYQQWENMDDLFTKKLYNSNEGLRILCRLVDDYVKSRTPLDEKFFIRVIENIGCDTAYAKMIFQKLQVCPELWPFSIEEYLDSLFDDLINGKNAMYHYWGSCFHKNNYEQQDVAYKLYSIFEPLEILYGKSREEFIELFASKVMLLDNPLDVATYISKYIELSEPEIADVFEEIILRMSDDLPRQRVSLILTLEQIKEACKKKHEKF